MPRLPDLDPETLTPEARAVYERIASGPRGGVRGPFVPLLRCPGIADPFQELGGELRFNGVLPGRLRELAILVAARFWTAQFEWRAHAVIAEKEGVDGEVIAAIAQGRTPDLAAADMKAVYDFSRELHETRRVSDVTYERAVAALGTDGVVELTVVAGYYTMISMILNTFEVEPPDGGAVLEDL
jgi:4-carboxymuconolactone decarboxylase